MRPFLLLAGLAVVAASGCGPSSGPPAAPEYPAPVLSLRPGRVAETDLRGGASRVWRLDLPPEQFAELVIEQNGIDAVVRLEDAAGRRLTEVDSVNGAQGPEPLLVVGGHEPWRLVIAAPDAQAPPGRVAIRVLALRPATQQDRARVAAERTFARAEALRRQGGGAALGQAVAEQERALAAFRALGDRQRVADSLDRLGRIHLLRGDAAAARTAYLQTLPLLRSLGARQATLDALNGLGTAARSLGRPAEALASYQEAREILAHLGDRRSEAMTWNNTGRALAMQGEAEEAFRAYDRALALWRDLGERGEEGITLGNVGRLYASLGVMDRASRALEQAAARLEAAGRLRDAAAARTDLGLTLARSGRRDDGLDSLGRALLLQRQAGDRHGEAITLNDLGWLHLQAPHLQAEDTAEARRCFEQALILFVRLGQRGDQAAALGNLGRLAARRGHPHEAIALYDRALPLLAAANDRGRQAGILADRALAWRQAGDLDEARRSLEAALERVETLRREPGSLDLRATYFASQQGLHEQLVDLLLELHRRRPAAGYAAEALAVSERARARSLLDMLAAAEGDPGQGADPALLAEEEVVGRRLAAAERRRRRLADSGAPDERSTAARAEVDALLRERERIEAEIRQAGRGVAPVVLTPDEIRHEVAPGTLLLEYSLGETRSFVWAVEAGRLDVFELAPRARIEEEARRAHTLLAAEDRTLAGPRIEASLAALSRLLLAPVADRLAGRRLLIVPDGALAYVPFAALPQPAAPAVPLVEAHEIVLLPSASTLAALRRRSRAMPPGILAVLADPVFAPDDPRLSGRPGDPPRTVARGSDPAAFLPRLPFSREEAAALLRLVPAERRFAALDFAAGRDTALGGTLSRYRILHFATHAVIDPEHPALSGIALSRFDARGRRREGFVRASEIWRLRLAADLVVLSACRTALGREVRGEGLLGLTQSFFQAGAQRVLVSLWPVDDRATAELMARFYREMLAGGRSPAAALRAAQSSLRREPAFAAPAFWAGFVLQGDPLTLPALPGINPERRIEPPPTERRKP